MTPPSYIPHHTYPIVKTRVYHSPSLLSLIALSIVYTSHAHLLLPSYQAEEEKPMHADNPFILPLSSVL